MFSEDDPDFLPVLKELVFDTCTLPYQCVFIPILNDLCVEEEENFYISIESDNSCVSFHTDVAEVIIHDDDCKIAVVIEKVIS